jgi:hypothetical protein
VWHRELNIMFFNLIKRGESLFDFFAQRLEASDDDGFPVDGVLKLHTAQLVHEVRHPLSYSSPGHAAAASFHRVCCRIIEANHTPQHPDSFVEWAETIVGRVAILLQKVVFDEFGDIQRYLVCLRQRTLHKLITL